MGRIWLAAAIFTASVWAQTPAARPVTSGANTAKPSPKALMAAARAALGPPVESLEVRGAFRLQLPNSSRQQQGNLAVTLLGRRDYQRRMAMRMPFGEFVTTETLVDGEVVVKRVAPPGMAQRFAAFRRDSGGRLSAAEREKVRGRRQAMLLRSVSAQAARDALAFLLAPPPGAALSYAGLAEARDGQQADMIAVSWPAPLAGAAAARGGAEPGAPEAKPMTLFLDHHTHRLLMLSYRGFAFSAMRERNPRGGRLMGQPHFSPRRPVTFFVHFTQWRRVDGHWFPFEITQSVDGKTFSEWDVKKVRVNPPGLTAKNFGQS